MEEKVAPSCEAALNVISTLAISGDIPAEQRFDSHIGYEATKVSIARCALTAKGSYTLGAKLEMVVTAVRDCF
jgi:hypothetical protein